MPKAGKTALSLAPLAILAALPLVTDAYTQYVINLILAYVVLAVGLNIVMGFAGQLSFAHSAFMGVGAYAMAVLMGRFDLLFLAALPLCGLITGLFGFIIGLPAVRVRGLYLALLTIALLYFVHWGLVHWDSVTKGANGLQVPRVSVLGRPINGDKEKFFVILPIVLIMVWLGVVITRSKWGRAFILVRDAELAAQASGIPLMLTKATAFAISAFYAAIGGGLFAITVDFLVPNSFGLLQMMTQFAMVLVGGLGSIFGAVAGAVVVGILPEILRELPGAEEIAYGAVILGCVLFMPEGIVGMLQTKRWLSRPIATSPRLEYIMGKPTLTGDRARQPVRHDERAAR